MWKRASDCLHRVSNGWVALCALVIMILFTVVVLPAQSSRAAGTGDVGSPDLSFYYSVEDLYRMAEAYGEEGRRAYVRARFTFDLIWPLVYTAFLGTAISWVYHRAFSPGSPWRRANLGPVLGALLDYLENVSTSLIMVRYPNRTVVVDLLAPVFTMTKWIFVSASFVLLVAGLAVSIWRWVRR